MKDSRYEKILIDKKIIEIYFSLNLIELNYF